MGGQVYSLIVIEVHVARLARIVTEDLVSSLWLHYLTPHSCALVV